MADNFSTPFGIVGGDDVGGVKYERVKAGFGEDGSYADVSDANPLPMRQLLYTGGGGFEVQRRASEAEGGESGVAAAAPMLWNGQSFERQRSNASGVAFASALRDGYSLSAAILNPSARGISLKLAGVSGSGAAVRVGVSPDAVGQVRFPSVTLDSGLLLYPGIDAELPEGAGALHQINGVVGRTIYISAEVMSGGPVTFSIAYTLIV